MLTDRSGQLAGISEDWRRHWRVGVAVTIGMGLGTSIMPSVFSLFILPLQHAFGWSRGAIGFANGATVIGGLVAPFAGRLIDRIGVRRPLLAGTVMLGLCWAALAAMPGSLAAFYLLFVLLTVFGLLTTGLTYSHVVCATFRRSRGFSLAISRSGVAVSATVLPGLLYAAMRIGGWRAGYLALAVLVLLVALPIVALWIRRADDPPPAKRAAIPPPASSDLDWRRVITIGVAAALAYLPLLAIMSQGQPLLVDRGVSPATAARLLGLFGIASFAGAIGTGLLIDRFWAPAVACLLLALGAAGALILALGPPGVATAAIGVALLGITLGAEIDLVAFVVARYCGVRRYGRVFGFTVLALSFASAAGSSTIGFLYDATGSYLVPLQLSALSFLGSGIAYLSLGAYPRPIPD